jgi:hypothetical protein
LTGLAYQFAAISNKRNDKRQFWQISNHFEEVFTEEFFWTKINRAANRYIHMNPVRSGIVSKASDYLYSSASNYVGRLSLLDVTLADMPILEDEWL